MDAWIELVSHRLGPPIMTTGDEVRFNCPSRKCSPPDTKYHMYVNPESGKFFCHRCRTGGSLDYLSKLLGITSPEKSLTMWRSIINNFLFGSGEVAVIERAEIPVDYIPMIKGTQAYSYVKSRDISDRKIDYYHIGFGTLSYGQVNDSNKGRYIGKNRIAMLDFDKDKRIEYWVSRTYSTHSNKYKNAKVSRDDKVFNLGNLERLNRRDRVVICEGPISAIVAGYDAVCTYGKHVTGKQISRLVELKAGEYVVAIDGDAVGDAVSLATRLHRRGCSVRFVRFSISEDPASVGSLEIRRRICRSIKWSPLVALEVML